MARYEKPWPRTATPRSAVTACCQRSLIAAACSAVSSASVSSVPVGMPPEVNHCEPNCCAEMPMPTDWRAAVSALMPMGEPGMVLMARCQIIDASTSMPPTL